MQSADQLASKQLVLLGIGHTNAHIVRQWRMNPISDVQLTCLSDHTVATYSGMLPAVLAGQLSEQDMQIDLVRLCASAGARLITEQVTGIDPESKRIEFATRPPISFDVLSVGVGSVPSVQGVEIDSTAPLLKIKPMQSFLQRLNEHVSRLQQIATDSTVRIVIAGSGVAGTEVAFCLPGWLKRNSIEQFDIRIVTGSQRVLNGVTSSLRRRVERALTDRAVTISLNERITHVEPEHVQSLSGAVYEADLVIWATGASPPPLLSQLGLPTDDRGFLLTDETLQSTAAGGVFAVGDSGTVNGTCLPKAGVYAVRQGPALWENIQRSIDCRALKPWVPQSSFMKLLNTGADSAIGEWKGLSFEGSWVLRLKDHIDRRFMRMYQTEGMAQSGHVMQCRGCGCKIAGDILDDALSELTSKPETPPLDDAALIETGAGTVVASTDFFSAPLNDLYLTGRIAALHSASDIVASGANVSAALANVVAPEGDPRAQGEGIRDLLAGAQLEFEAMGGRIAGGHTIVGARWEIGFAVIGTPVGRAVVEKGNLKPGDHLVLTKPLGVGVLLAAHMRSQCAAGHFETMIESMLHRQHRCAGVAAELGITAGTDVTGFGLIGHLNEMLEASGVSAALNLSQIPLLPGAAETFQAGIESTLAPANRRLESLADVGEGIRRQPAWQALFDPQTCGGLLLGIADDRLEEARAALETADIYCFAQVGRVHEQGEQRLIIES